MTDDVVVLERVVGNDFRELHLLSFRHNVGFFFDFGSRTTRFWETFSTVSLGSSMKTVFALMSTFNTA